jgi:hypothetical protein
MVGRPAGLSVKARSIPTLGSPRRPQRPKPGTLPADANCHYLTTIAKCVILLFVEMLVESQSK